MSMTDPIADLLTRIRNAHTAKLESVDVPNSKIKRQLVQIMKDEGYVADYANVENPPQGTLRIQLKYLPNGEPAIRGIERVSKPSRRVYRGKSDIPKVIDGLGIVVVSTPKGLMTGGACKDSNVGGELLCNIW